MSVRRTRQKLEEITSLLSELESSWKDAHAEAVINMIHDLPQGRTYTLADVRQILSGDFDAGTTLLRLALGMSKDELGIAMRAALGEGRTGIKQYTADSDRYLKGLVELGVLTALSELATRPVSGRDILVERLKYGRGSAIKGQSRGRSLEDFAEEIVKRVFGPSSYDSRCRFVGARGTSTEKADFAIPSKFDPVILIEAKGYGATGSKQTDVLGDVEKIDAQKRPDTLLLMVVDGVTWRQRLNDLRKLVQMQNEGRIARIYTQKMAGELEADLEELREHYSL